MPFKHLQQQPFYTAYAIKDQELVTEYTINLFNRRLKKETTDIFNRMQVVFERLALEWNAVEQYEFGEIVSYNRKNYICTSVNVNQSPVGMNGHLFWSEITASDLSDFNASMYLAKDNDDPYDPGKSYNKVKNEIVDYHPTTIKWVREELQRWFNNVTITNADKLDGYHANNFVTQDEFQLLITSWLRNEDVIDNLISTDTDLPLSANQGRILYNYILKINDILDCNDFDLDEIQEIVDYIKKLKQRIDEHDVRLDEHDATLENHEERIKALETAVADIYNQLTIIYNHIDRLDKRIDEQGDELEDLTKRVARDEGLLNHSLSDKSSTAVTLKDGTKTTYAKLSENLGNGSISIIDNYIRIRDLETRLGEFETLEEKIMEIISDLRLPVWIGDRKLFYGAYYKGYGSVDYNFYVDNKTGSDDQTYTYTDENGKTITKEIPIYQKGSFLNPFHTIQACIDFICSNYNMDTISPSIRVKYNPDLPYDVKESNYDAQLEKYKDNPDEWDYADVDSNRGNIIYLRNFTRTSGSIFISPWYYDYGKLRYTDNESYLKLLRSNLENATAIYDADGKNKIADKFTDAEIEEILSVYTNTIDRDLEKGYQKSRLMKKGTPEEVAEKWAEMWVSYNDRALEANANYSEWFERDFRKIYNGNNKLYYYVNSSECKFLDYSQSDKENKFYKKLPRISTIDKTAGSLSGGRWILENMWVDHKIRAGTRVDYGGAWAYCLVGNTTSTDSTLTIRGGYYTSDISSKNTSKSTIWNGYYRLSGVNYYRNVNIESNNFNIFFHLKANPDKVSYHLFDGFSGIQNFGGINIYDNYSYFLLNADNLVLQCGWRNHQITHTLGTDYSMKWKFINSHSNVTNYILSENAMMDTTANTNFTKRFDKDNKVYHDAKVY